MAALLGAAGATIAAMGRRLLSVVLALAAVAAGGLAQGCGSSKTSVDPVARAAAVTARVPGYRIAATVSTTTPATGTQHVLLNGVFDRASRSGEMRATDTVLGRHIQFTEVFSGLTFYMQSRSLPQLARLTGGKHWLKMDMSRMLGGLGLSSFSTSTDPSQFVDYLRDVSASTKKIGGQTIRGVPSTHYHAVVDLRRYVDLVPPSQRAAAARGVQTLQMALGGHTMAMDVWIDHANLVRRLAFNFTECVNRLHLQFGMAMDLYDYGPQSQPQLPVAGDTYDLTPLLASSLSRIKFGCSAG